ncbi:MAG: sigma 54-interacting transcriptional regulator [Desulfuromonadales bacterium]|nr:sigma 54-interacting transcriptional regulator [Desulfuromonadales bacterium]
MSQNPIIYKHILQNMTEGIIFVDANDRIVFINGAAEEIRGIEAENFIGRSLLSIHSPKTAQRIQTLLNGLRNGSIKESKRIIHVKGLYFENCYYPVKSPDGTYVGAFMISTDITDRQQLKSENQSLKENIISSGFNGYIGISPSMTTLIRTIGAIANLDSTVLITGESGTGKELVARNIHNNSYRKDKKMIAVNCAAFPEHLVESELFGYKKGAFTGAIKDHSGKFQLADNSTIFLDEVGDLPLAVQAKLLRVLQERCITMLGSEKEIKVNVRVIAATNKNLKEMVENGTFRDDLFYRLNVINIPVPPLRERKDDILSMADYFVKKFSMQMGKNVRGINKEAQNVLSQYSYPGNVRELENSIEHGVAFCSTEFITISDLPKQFIVETSAKNSPDNQSPITPKSKKSNSEFISLADAKEKSEQTVILEALTRTGGRKGEAAKLLNISRKTLWDKLKQIK